MQEGGLESARRFIAAKSALLGSGAVRERCRELLSESPCTVVLWKSWYLRLPRKPTAGRQGQCPSSAISLAGFQMATHGRFWVATEGEIVPSSPLRTIFLAISAHQLWRKDIGAVAQAFLCSA